MFKLGALDLHASEEEAEDVEQLALHLVVEQTAALGVGVEERVEDGLGDDIVEAFEELGFHLLLQFHVLYYRERDIIRSYSVKQEFLVRDVVVSVRFLLFEDLADDVPEGVRDNGVGVLHVEDLVPLQHVRLVPEWHLQSHVFLYI